MSDDPRTMTIDLLREGLGRKGAFATLRPIDFKVYFAMAVIFRNNASGLARPSIKELSRVTGMSKTQLTVAIDRLCNRTKLMELLKRGCPGRPSEYLVHLGRSRFPGKDYHRKHGDDHQRESGNNQHPEPGHDPQRYRVSERRNRVPEKTQPGTRTPTVSPEPVVLTVSGCLTDKGGEGGNGRIPHVDIEDLRDPDRLQSLFEECVARGLVKNCEADHVDFFDAAQRCLRKGKNEPALFRSVIVRWDECRHFATIRDEEAGRRARLKIG